MNENEISPIEQLNAEYKAILASKEYLTGKKVLKFKYYLKKFKFITLFKKIISSKKSKKYVYKKDNYNNEKLFIDNEKNTIKSYDKNSKIVIYTVNIGKYDNLVQPLFDNENVDFILVSDNKPEHLGKWKWLDAKPIIGNLNLSNVKKARFIKTHPHLLFKDYKYSIFIDGNIRCVSDITKFINKINKTTKIAIHPHPYRDCIYSEIISCKIRGKGNYNVMLNQINKYKNEGMPKRFGLFETGVLVREHNNPICIDLMEKWWNEIKNNSERDQLSLTYVLWKNGYSANDFGIISNSIKDNNSLQIIDHIEDYMK